MNARFNLIPTVPVEGSQSTAEFVKAGLSKESKSLPYFLLYDDVGSDIFEEITTLEEYYPTKAEAQIIGNQSAQILNHSQPFTALIELGSGSSTKTRPIIRQLLDRIHQCRQTDIHHKLIYVPIDISKKILQDSSLELLREIPDEDFSIHAVHGFYGQGLEAVNRLFPDARKLVIWLGSSIGNYSKIEAAEFLRSLRPYFSSNDRFLIGIDLMKSASVLHTAYDDPRGVTARFTLNILTRLNSNLGANFDVSAFKHEAMVDEASRKVVVSLVSQRDQTVHIKSLDTDFKFKSGEKVHIEDCCKFNEEDILALSKNSGFDVEASYYDTAHLFSMRMFAPAGAEEPKNVTYANAGELRRGLEAGWALSDHMFSLLSDPKNIMLQPILLRHPIIFYIGHLASFYHGHLLSNLMNKPSFNPRFEVMFARGIDPSVDDPTKCHSHSERPSIWPTYEELCNYKKEARQRVLSLLPEICQKKNGLRTAKMCEEHELMHSETLLYMLAQTESSILNTTLFSHAPTSTHHTTTPSTALTDVGKFILINGGEVELGAEPVKDSFGWDNEFPRQRVSVPSFSVGAYPVTNGQFLEFVESGAYNKSSFWTESDWKWKNCEGLSHPNSWIKNEDGTFMLRVLGGRIPLKEALMWPVYTSYAESQAFAKWKGARLLTEPEFHLVAYGKDRLHPWGDADPVPGYHGNFGFKHWSPCSVSDHPNGATPEGVFDLVGNGWEWTSSFFAPFPGYIADSPFYPGYSYDFFDNDHHVMKGASWATATPLIRKSFRNFFQPHYQYMFAKFRLAKSE